MMRKDLYNVNGTYKDYVIPEEIITKKKGLKATKTHIMRRD